MFICKQCSTSTKISFSASDSVCKKCGTKTIELSFNIYEFKNLSSFGNFQLLVDMDKLKRENPIDFQIKYNQIVQTMPHPAIPMEQQTSPQSTVPRCPTCGSTNIKKISGTKRWLTTGMFGLGSSNVGKVMECLNCHAKW